MIPLTEISVTGKMVIYGDSAYSCFVVVIPGGTNTISTFRCIFDIIVNLFCVKRGRVGDKVIEIDFKTYFMLNLYYELNWIENLLSYMLFVQHESKICFCCEFMSRANYKFCNNWVLNYKYWDYNFLQQQGEKAFLRKSFLIWDKVTFPHCAHWAKCVCALRRKYFAWSEKKVVWLNNNKDLINIYKKNIKILFKY